MNLNKLYLVCLCFLALIPSGAAKAYLGFPVYGQNDNPIYVTPVLTQEQKNEQKKFQLQSLYGIQAYNRCSSSCNDFDPMFGASCLINIESCLRTFHSSPTPTPNQSYSAPSCSPGYVPQNGSCVTPDQGCQNKNGSFFGWSGKIVNGQYECVCKPGFALDVVKNACVFATCPLGQGWDGARCVAYDALCKSAYGQSSVWTGKEADISCICSSGYEWNVGKTACVRTAPPSCAPDSIWDANRAACVVSIVTTNDQTTDHIIAQESSLTKVNRVISNKLRGRILLQAVPGEQAPRAWYVNPRDLKRYYISSDADLLFVLQHMSRFVSPAQFKKIQKNPKLASGYFMVVTSGGGNHFLNPKDGRIYDLPSGFSGAQSLLVLEVAVGSPMTDADLRKIAVGKLE